MTQIQACNRNLDLILWLFPNKDGEITYPYLTLIWLSNASHGHQGIIFRGSCPSNVSWNGGTEKIHQEKICLDRYGDGPIEKTKSTN
jgi:hypothetical protein